jgi:hypothetical protein
MTHGRLHEKGITSKAFCGYTISYIILATQLVLQHSWLCNATGFATPQQECRFGNGRLQENGVTGKAFWGYTISYIILATQPILQHNWFRNTATRKQVLQHC